MGTQGVTGALLVRIGLTVQVHDGDAVVGDSVNPVGTYLVGGATSRNASHLVGVHRWFSFKSDNIDIVNLLGADDNIVDGDEDECLIPADYVAHSFSIRMRNQIINYSIYLQKKQYTVHW